MFVSWNFFHKTWTKLGTKNMNAASILRNYCQAWFLNSSMQKKFISVYRKMLKISRNQKISNKSSLECKEPSRAKIQPDWILQFMTLFVTMGSIVFTWNLFEVALGARPIPILYPCFFVLDKSKKQNGINKMELRQQIRKTRMFISLYGKLYLFYSLPI